MPSTRLYVFGAALLSALTALSVLLTPAPPTPLTDTPSSASGGMTVSVRRSHGLVEVAGSEVYAEVAVSLRAEEAPAAERQVSLMLLLDRSCSMSGEKLAAAQNAARRLVASLRPDDELGLVVFGSRVEPLERRRMTDEGRQAMLAAIEQLSVDGSTNISGALSEGSRLLRGAPGVRRMVLVSDGQPNEGDISPDGLARLAGAAHDEGITLTTLGVGADYDGPLMQQLAERGGGMYGYLASAAMLEDILARELLAARRSVVRDVQLELTTAGGFEVASVPGRTAQRFGPGKALLRLADLQPGATTKVWVHLRNGHVDDRSRPTLTAEVRWRRVDADDVARLQVDVPFVATADADAFLQSRDEAVFSEAISALGATQLLAASAAYERGDDASARSLLDNARAIFGMSADALAGTTEVLNMERSFSQAGAGERRSLARQVERQQMKSFGLENQGY